jgi:hypothetical protein
VVLLLNTGWRATSYLIPVIWAVAGLAVTPYAVGRLWTYYPAYHSSGFDWSTGFERPTVDRPERYVFDPQTGSFGAAAGCLLMVTAAGALLVLRVRRAVGTR